MKARATCTCQVSTNSKNYLIVTKHNWHIWFSVLKTRGLGKSRGIYITFIKGILLGEINNIMHIGFELFNQRVPRLFTKHIEE